MNIRKISFTPLVLIVGLMIIWVSRNPDWNNPIDQGTIPYAGFKAPEFSLKSIDDSEFRLSSFIGHPVIINIWASWCPPCKAEMPAMERVLRDYQDDGLIILAVNTTYQDNLIDVENYVEDMGLTFPILIDSNGEVSSLYQLRSLPTTFFIDKAGVIREVILGGPMAEALLRVRIENLIREDKQ